MLCPILTLARRLASARASASGGDHNQTLAKVWLIGPRRPWRTLTRTQKSPQWSDSEARRGKTKGYERCEHTVLILARALPRVECGWGIIL